jgi:sugar lactone lactonase YvrE
MKIGRYLYVVGLMATAAIGLGLWHPLATAQSGRRFPKYRVDPFWPKPLPNPKDEKGISHQWVTGEVGATCIDSRDHIVTVNRGFQKNGLLSGPTGPQEGVTSIPAPPVVVYDVDGNVVDSWGDPTLTPAGPPAVMPAAPHGCFVDYQDNIWIAGNGDGVVQKWSHDGKKMLLQIGTKGMCDGPPSRPRAAYPTCGEPGGNSSHTLLNQPADIAVDPNPDPVTGQRGSVYIADGYGNHRIVVFDADGTYLRQWGSAGSGPGQFAQSGGGHPHCVVLGNDGLVYTCDRQGNRIEVFDKTGGLKRIIPIDPPEQMPATMRADDIVFSEDAQQTFFFDADLGSDRIWILHRESGMLGGNFGGPGHMAGQLTYPHTVVTDSKGNVYVAETIGGRRVQKFVKVNQ